MVNKTNKTSMSGKTTNYPVGDFLIRLKNAVLADKKTLEVPLSRLVKEVAKALAKEKFLEEVSEKEGRLFLRIAYHKKEPILSDIRLVSKPGLRVYMSAKEIGKKKGPSIFIISTPKGVMTSKEAIKKNLGGEVIAEIL